MLANLVSVVTSHLCLALTHQPGHVQVEGVVKTTVVAVGAENLYLTASLTQFLFSLLLVYTDMEALVGVLKFSRVKTGMGVTRTIKF